MGARPTLSPSYPAYANLGFLYHARHDYTNAAAVTEKALALNDKNFMVWANLAAAYESLGDSNKAAAAQEREQPLLEQANFNQTPNPSKAPWYFLGLQELLTIWHPMVAGVTIPGMGLIVLMMAPYIDKNPATKPNERKFAICLFTLFLMFWAVLVIIGSFFRGPGFNFVYPWKAGTFFDL